MDPFSVRFPQARWIALLCLLALVSGGVRTAHASSGKQRYSRRVRFALNQTVVFPDFTLRYIGQTHVKSAVFLPSFTYENFVVSAGGHEQTVQWCGGTGIPFPSAFKVGRKLFQLELYGSLRFGSIGAGKLVISPAPED